MKPENIIFSSLLGSNLIESNTDLPDVEELANEIVTDLKKRGFSIVNNKEKKAKTRPQMPQTSSIRTKNF